MAITYYFFDAVESGGTYDRTYSAGDFTKYLKGIVGSGVLPIPSDSLQVYAGTGLQVIVKPGTGWIEGHRIDNDADLSLSIDAADVTLNRIDRVVMQLDVQDRKMNIVVKKGSAGSSPTPPELVRTQDMIEYCLATVTVNRNATSISQSMITDTRLDSSVCGMVAGLIQQVDTTTLFNQYSTAYAEMMEKNQKDFDSWFQNVKDTLSSNPVIQSYSNRVVMGSAGTSVSIDISQYVRELDILEVYVDGLRLDSTEYNIDSGGNTITFTHTIDSGAVVEIVVYKTVDRSSL